MKFKKITALLMAAAMTLSLAGCGGSGASTTDGTSAEESTDVVSGGGVIQRMRQQTMRLKKKRLR